MPWFFPILLGASIVLDEFEPVPW
jgi:hypothetical protein